jgi:N-acetyl-anhydromuramyl-L-alanine amidase AmpD
VGSKTWEVIGIDTDNEASAQESEYITKNGLTIDRQYLDKDEYVRDYGKIEPLGFFIHHTAGWDNPYNVVRNWNNDKRGRVATQYVIGGSNVKGKTKHDGVVVECFPNNYLGWHLGKVGDFKISKLSGGVELCNFGYLTKKGDRYYTYVNTEVKPEFVCDLGYKFRGHQYWHAYTDKQIESLRLLILHLRDIYPKMDLVNGLPKLLKEGVSPADAFEFNSDAYNAKQFGLWTHTNVRKDKFDCFPQPELVEMLKQL